MLQTNAVEARGAEAEGPKRQARAAANQSPYRVVFAGVRSPHNGHPAILVERRWFASK